jgi:beta-N-acetylhexosaminidase
MIVGIEGPELTAVERAWLKLIRAGGVILFRRNIEAPAQTFALLAEINKIIGCDVFRCVDVEGGLVDRLRDAVAPMPSAAAVAASGTRALYRRHGALIGRELRALGFNTTLAPVLDLALAESRTVMRTRTPSADPARVIDYAGGFLEGLAAEGVLGCGKHFPGLGGGVLDSHEATPAIARGWDEMWETDLLPYRALAKKLPLVMVSHAVYPEALHRAGPASVSPEWIAGVLKKRIKFGGLAISDDLEMGGILSRASIEDAAVNAIAAGTHLVEICKDPALIFAAYEAVLAEAERSAIYRKIIEAAARKGAVARKRLAPGASRAPSTAATERLRGQIGAFSALVAETHGGET